jgi:hypothetical protein
VWFFYFITAIFDLVHTWCHIFCTIETAFLSQQFWKARAHTLNHRVPVTGRQRCFNVPALMLQFLPGENIGK